MVAMSTDRPQSSWAWPSSADPLTKLLKAILASAPETKRSARLPAVLRACQRDEELGCCIFVRTDEVAKGYGKENIFRGSEGVDSQRILETAYKNRKAQRIQT